MPWYIPIVGAVIGVFGGWIIRAFYDSRSERLYEYREVFKAYMSLTDAPSAPPDLPNDYRMWALLRAGALRLRPVDFERLLVDIARVGRGIHLEDSIIESLGCRNCLIYAVASGADLRDPVNFIDGIMALMVQAEDQGRILGAEEAERLLAGLGRPKLRRPPESENII